jgi:hypothetical protein
MRGLGGFPWRKTQVAQGTCGVAMYFPKKQQHMQNILFPFFAVQPFFVIFHYNDISPLWLTPKGLYDEWTAVNLLTRRRACHILHPYAPHFMLSHCQSLLLKCTLNVHFNNKIGSHHATPKL